MCRVRYSKSARLITITRYIVGKLLFQRKNVSLAELLILYDNQLNLESLARKDKGFRQKFGSSLEELSHILSITPLDLHHPQRAINGLRIKLAEIRKFGIPRRNLANLGIRLHNWSWLEVHTSQGIEKCRLPPKKVIAKGYTDKGSARNLAIDGSPKWQEIATADLEFLQSLERLRKLTLKG